MLRTYNRVPGTEQAVRDSYTQFQLPSWDIQRKMGVLSLTHSESKELDRRNGSGEVLSLS